MNKYIFLFFLLAGCNEDISSEIYSAILNDDLKAIEKLVHSGVELNKRYYDGWTPLTLAVTRGNIEMVKLLIEKGADVNYIEGGGNSSLFWASFYGNKELVELLLADKADPCIIGKKNTYPKEIARIKKFSEIENIIPVCKTSLKNQ